MFAKSKIIKMEIFYQWTFEIIQKFGQKMKNFNNFFDVHMDISVIVNDIKKNFKFSYFMAKFFSWSANTHYDEKNFCYKIFCWQNKSDVTDLRYVSVAIKKLVFSSTIVYLLLKTNFWMPTTTYLKFTLSNFHSGHRILDQNFFSSQCVFALHDINLAKKWKNLKIFLISLTITFVSICTSKNFLKFFVFRPNFWIISKVHRQIISKSSAITYLKFISTQEIENPLDHWSLG